MHTDIHTPPTHPVLSSVLGSPKIKAALETLMCNKSIPKERHKRAVAASRLKAGNDLADMAMDGIFLAPPPPVAKVKFCTQ